MVHAKQCRMHIQIIENIEVFLSIVEHEFPFSLNSYLLDESTIVLDFMYYFILPFGPKFSMTKKIVK